MEYFYQKSHRSIYTEVFYNASKNVIKATAGPSRRRVLSHRVAMLCFTALQSDVK